MSAGAIAILTTCGLILVAMIGGWVELVKSRRAQTRVEHEVTPNSGKSLRDEIDRIRSTIDKMDEKVDRQGERLVRVETLVNVNHVIQKQE